MIDWTQAIQNYLTGAVSSRFRNQDAAVVEHWQGRDNLLWRVRTGGGDDAVVKMFTDAGQARSRRQFSGHEQFAAAGLAPQPLWYDRYPHGLPRQLLVYRWADGGPVRLADPKHRAALAAAVACVHRADPGAVQRFSPHPFNLLTFWQIWQAGEAPLRTWIEQCPAPLLAEILAMLWSAAHRTMDAALQQLGETPPTPVHGELTAQNALFDADRVILVDWEFFGLGDPAQEVARLLFFEGKDWARRNRETWWDGYSPFQSEPGMPDRVELYLRLFHFQAATFLLDGVRQGEMPASAAEELESDSDASSYRVFLAGALIAALRSSLEIWELPRLSETDDNLLAAELDQIMNVQMTHLHTTAPAAG
ncbi:MAG: aminoglycoside phosphotransferase family protein [Caldilineaceae bacterium]|nr:aminoglycoside phosphotransferase family protein [Caldilineaceae bacterium]